MFNVYSLTQSGTPRVRKRISKQNLQSFTPRFHRIKRRTCRVQLYYIYMYIVFLLSFAFSVFFCIRSFINHKTMCCTFFRSSQLCCFESMYSIYRSHSTYMLHTNFRPTYMCSGFQYFCIYVEWRKKKVLLLNSVRVDLKLT